MSAVLLFMGIGLGGAVMGAFHLLALRVVSLRHVLLFIILIIALTAYGLSFQPQ